jgi:hypothetical protein
MDSMAALSQHGWLSLDASRPPYLNKPQQAASG